MTTKKQLEANRMLSISEAIVTECDNVANMLLSKNERYGNSALDPVRIFSDAPADEQIRVRIDDKISRIARGKGTELEDVISDLLGYLILLKVSRRTDVYFKE